MGSWAQRLDDPRSENEPTRAFQGGRESKPAQAHVLLDSSRLGPQPALWCGSTVDPQYANATVPRNAGTEDDRWSVVLAALQDAAWDFRTVEGIAKDSQLPRGTVERLLLEHQSELRRRRGRDGRTIYTLKSKPVSVREIVADLQVFASKSF